MKIFLGGTCNGSSWRGKLIPLLQIDYFDPVVDDWNDEAAARELRERETADYVLYTFTPASDSLYSVAEVVDDSHKIPGNTLMCVLQEDDGVVYSKHQKKALDRIMQMVSRNGAHAFTSLEDVADFVNAS